MVASGKIGEILPSRKIPAINVVVLIWGSNGYHWSTHTKRRSGMQMSDAL